MPLNIEWNHMTKGQRVGYFLSEYTIAWFFFFFIAGFAIAFDNGNYWSSAFYGFVTGLLCVCLPLWAFKFIKVKNSLRRCPVDKTS
jgi:hypothetical protein